MPNPVVLRKEIFARRPFSSADRLKEGSRPSDWLGMAARISREDRWKIQS